MKEAAKKKPKVFRTLIRRIHTGKKPPAKDINSQAAAKKSKKREKRPPFFFGG